MEAVSFHDEFLLSPLAYGITDTEGEILNLGVAA